MTLGVDRSSDGRNQRAIDERSRISHARVRSQNRIPVSSARGSGRCLRDTRARNDNERRDERVRCRARAREDERRVKFRTLSAVRTSIVLNVNRRPSTATCRPLVNRDYALELARSLLRHPRDSTAFPTRVRVRAYIRHALRDHVSVSRARMLIQVSPTSIDDGGHFGALR